MEMIRLSIVENRPFIIEERETNKGKAVYTTESFSRGTLIARFNGTILPYRTQHTLQIDEIRHLEDLTFVGFLAHSCSPNVFVDMNALEVWALKDIEENTAFTMDYASTEDILYKQFRCACGSLNCRGWITGRKELPARGLIDDHMEENFLRQNSLHYA